MGRRLRPASRDSEFEFDLVDGLIVRAHPIEAVAALNDPFVARALTRPARGRPVYMLAWDEPSRMHKLMPLTASAALMTEGDVGTTLAAVRNAELLDLIERSGVMLAPHADYHYAPPNDSHYKQYVRVPLALHSLEALDAVAFWLLPHLEGDPIVLTDSGGLTGLALAAKRYAADVGLGLPENIGLTEHLRSVDEARQSTYLEQRLSYMQTQGDIDRLLVLLSVSDSGSTRDTLLGVGRSLQLDSTAVSLFCPPGYVASENETAMAHLESGFGQEPKKDCSMCAQRSVAVKIHPETSLMETFSESQPETLSAADCAAMKEFCDRYPGTNCIRLHRTEHDGRHHGIDIDVGAIVDEAAFRQRLALELADWCGEIDTILAPEHEVACRLAAAAAEVLGVPGGQVILCDESKLSSYDNLDTTSCVLRAARRLLIIDDVTITGGRVRRYRDALNRCNLMHDDDTVRVLFGVARPMRPDLLSGVADSTFMPSERRTHCRWIERITLPRWDERTCPWCREHKLLKDTGLETRADTAVSARLRSLERLESGLNADEVFLRLPSAGALALGSGSFLGARDPIETIACVASGIEEMRIQGRLRPLRRFPVASAVDIAASTTAMVDELTRDSVMNLERGLARWFEGILAASILRACDPTDIVNHHTADPLWDHTHDVIRAAAEQRDDRAAEYLLAIATGKLPRAIPDDLEIVPEDRALWSALAGVR